MKDNQEWLLNHTINLIKGSTVEKHKESLSNLNVSTIVEMIYLFKDIINDTMYDFIRLRKDINLPSIGIIKIKKNRLQVGKLVKDYLEDKKVDTEKDLSDLDKVKLKRLKIDIANNNKVSVIHEIRTTLSENLLNKLKKE